MFLKQERPEKKKKKTSYRSFKIFDLECKFFFYVLPHSLKPKQIFAVDLSETTQLIMVSDKKISGLSLD